MQIVKVKNNGKFALVFRSMDATTDAALRYTCMSRDHWAGCLLKCKKTALHRRYFTCAAAVQKLSESSRPKVGPRTKPAYSGFYEI